MTSFEETIIEAGQPGKQYFRDLWRYRELFLFLAWRDLLVRYKQTMVGVAWSLIRPALTMFILTIVFGHFGNMPSGGVPYPLVVLCGLLPWQFFSTVLSDGGNSLVSNSGLVSKVYFPRLIIPAGGLITGLVDFFISLSLLASVMIWYGWKPADNIFFLPLFVLFAMIVSFGAAAWASSLTVKYRDFRIIVPFAIQLGLYISPVGFVSSIVPQRYQLLYALNPMSGVIDGFRWSILGSQHPILLQNMIVSFAVAIFILFSGIRYFRRAERTFADVI